jgi:hypothetical protein
MKALPLLACLLAASGHLFAADAGPKDELKAAAKALGDKPNYSWKSNVENAGGGGGGRMGGPTEGKTEKDGVTHLSMTRGETTTLALLKGGKGVVKTPDGWQTAEDLAADQDRQNPARGAARQLQNFKTPAVQAADLAEQAKELKKDGDAVAGDLTEAGAKSLLSFGGRGGGNGPEISGAKGSVKFWVKDGVLAKYQFKVQGSVSWNGNDREVDRTTTVEIKDVGTTKIEVPEDAKKKLQ